MVAMFAVLILLLVVQAVFCKFYIYDWADEFDDVWPPANNQLSDKSGYNHVSKLTIYLFIALSKFPGSYCLYLNIQGFRENFGAGKVLDSDLGLFQTWQFSLYKNVMARLRVSEHRTRNPAEATSFSK